METDDLSSNHLDSPDTAAAKLHFPAAAGRNIFLVLDAVLECGAVAEYALASVAFEELCRSGTV